MKRLIVLGTAAAAIAVVLVIAGVGGSGTETAPRSTIADAAAATARTTGYRIALDATTEIPGQGRVAMKGTGVMDPRGRRGRMTITLGALRMEQVFSDFVFYMRSPLFERQLPDGKSWVKVDIARVGRKIGFDFNQITSGDPSQTLDQLRAVSGDVERVGRTRVRGVATTHYRATVDMRRYPNLVPPAKRDAVRKSVERLEELSGGVSKFPQEVWVGSDGRIRRIALEYSMRAPGVDGRTKTSLVMDLYGFGATVDAEIPPEDEVLDATELSQAALGKQ